VIATMRPKQWIKNVLVVAAAGAAGAFGHDDTPGRVIVACLAFCLLASGIYAINDVRDAEEDRRHPRKRFRPVAAGELDPRFATGLGVSLLLGGILLCAAIAPLLALVGGAYAALTLSYTLVWRNVIVFDIFAVAGGFVLRAVAGGVAAPVTLSRWFLLVVTSSAVFVAAAKRYAELLRSEGPRDRRRRVLDSYSPRSLELIMAGAIALALLAYCMWAFRGDR
jgi:decaprenyl-phosphate phosphoribosyltransferase